MGLGGLEYQSVSPQRQQNVSHLVYQLSEDVHAIGADNVVNRYCGVQGNSTVLAVYAPQMVGQDSKVRE